jgi:DNA-binding MarR family transcriptional regulator
MVDMTAHSSGKAPAPLTALQQPIDARDVVTERIATAIDTDEFTPRLLALLSNALVAAQSQGFRDEAGISTHEWRVLAALAHDPGQSASEISASLSVNKALISAAVNRLANERLIVLVDGPRRSRRMFLTHEGVRMHDRLAPIAQRGLQIVADELSPNELSAFNALLRRLTERARRLSGA